MLSMNHRNLAKTLMERGENRAHGLRFSAFRPPWTGLIIPPVEIEMSVVDTFHYESFQEQSGNDRAGEWF